MPPLLTSDSAAFPPRFRIDDLEIDVGKAEVTRQGEAISLPKLSFDLLFALMKAAPSIVTNDELLEQVWPGLHVSPESVSQRVKLLRSALGDDSQQPRYILGVRGRGYRLIPTVQQFDPGALNRDPVHQPADLPSAAKPGEAISQSDTPKGLQGHSKRVPIGVAALVAMGVAVWVGWHAWSLRHNAAGPSAASVADKTIAVLPFADMSEKKDQEYFADGMAEEIIDLLAKIPILKVIGRTSSFQFKGKTEDLRNIGSQLGAAYLLEGSVRTSGDRVRVAVQLIDSRSGLPRWSQTYDRNFGEVLKLQDEIATRVVRLVENDAYYSEIVSGKTLRSPEAYTAYLQGRYAKDRYDQPGLEQAMSDFQRAMELDPTFADAAAGLANVYLNLGAFGLLPPAVAYEKGRLAAQLALKLDPNQYEAHAVLSNIHINYDWDWPAAEREFKLALVGAPEFAARQEDSLLSLTMGRCDDALRAINLGLAGDPMDPDGHFFLGLAQLCRGRLPEAQAALNRVIELSPTYTFAHYELGLVELARNDAERALAEFSKESSEGARIVGPALAYFTLGRNAESNAALAQLIKSYSAVSPSAIASVYAFRGESDEAFKWLERAYTERDTLLPAIKYRTEFYRLHDDPRYKALLKKLNLPE
jgi:TolB-like protein/DNA-binding winged helix-turn-helix (wHTH) protein/Flp pilus assembly protein TadD